MAEVLLRVVDKVNPSDAALDAVCAKAGDVITVQADGWGWTVGELSNPDWVVVKAPGIDPAVLIDMIESNFDGMQRLVRKRARYIDLTKPVIAAALAGLDPDNRVIELNTGTKRNNFLAARVTKAPIEDIVILG